MERPRFYALPADIIERQDLSPSGKLVLMALAHHAWGLKTEVWPSVTHIARSVGIRSRTTVQTAIKELQGAGLVVAVSVRHDADKHGAQTSNLYHLSPCTKIVQPPAQELSTPSTDVEQSPPNSQSPPRTEVGHKVSKLLTTQREVNDSPSQDKPTKKPRKPPSEKLPNPFMVAAQQVVARLHELRTEAGMTGIEDWGAAKAAMRNVLKGQAGAIPIPVEEAIATLEWAWNDQRRRDMLLNRGVTWLRGFWSDWRQAGQPLGVSPDASQGAPAEDQVSRMLRELRQGKEGGNRGAGIRRDQIAQHGDPRSEYEYTEPE